MKGYTVITSDEKKAGRVVDERGDYLVVEHGTLRKTRRPLPRAFAHADDAERVVRATVPSGVLNESPQIGDDEAIARHYGLAGPDADPATRGEGDILPSATAEPSGDAPAADRAVTREHMGPGEGENDRGSSIGVTGGDRFRDAEPR
jgi:hypothetical protein